MLGRAKAGREWPCGGLDGIVTFAGDSPSVALSPWAEPLAMCGSCAPQRERDREWLGGDCNHVIARARGERADRSPMAVGPS